MEKPWVAGAKTAVKDSLVSDVLAADEVALIALEEEQPSVAEK